MAGPLTEPKDKDEVRRACQAVFERANKAGLGNPDTMHRWAIISNIAERARMEPSHVWRILFQKRKPNIFSFHELATALDMTMDELFYLLYRWTKQST
jgi:hypothetical protein